MVINFTGKAANPYNSTIAMEGDNLIEEIQFTGLPTLTTPQLATLHIINKLGVADTIDLTDNKLGVKNEITSVAGFFAAFIRITGTGGELWHSSPFYIKIGDLPGVDDAIEKEFPTAVQHMLFKMIEHSADMDTRETSIDGKVTSAQTAQTGAETAQGIAEEQAGIATTKATEAAGSAGTANDDREIIEGVKGEVLAVLESEEDREIAEEDRNTSEIERKEAEIQRELAKAQTLADLEGEYAEDLAEAKATLAAIASEFTIMIIDGGEFTDTLNYKTFEGGEF